MKRSILAVVAGVVTIGVLAVAGDAVTRQVAPNAFDARGFSDNTMVLLASLVYTVVSSAVGGWVTARVGRRTGLSDVWILAGLQFVMTLVANAILWDRRLVWFYAAGLVLTIPAIIAGGRFHLARQPQPAAFARG